MDTGGPNGANENGTRNIKTVADGRFSIRTSKSVYDRAKSSNATRGYHYAILATLLNVFFLAIALGSGIYIAGQYILVAIFIILVIMVLAQLFAQFNTIMWRSTTYSIEEYPDIHTLIEAVSDEMDIKTPKITVYEDSNAHAKVMPLLGNSVFGVPANRLYLTTGLIETFEDEEIAAIISHELAHIHHSDPYFRTFSALTQATTMLTGTAIVFAIFAKAPGIIQTTNTISHGVLVDTLLPLIIGILTLVGGWVLDSQYKQTAEYLADSTASDYTSAKAVHRMLLSLSPSGLNEDIVDPYPLFEPYPPMQNRIKRMKAKKKLRNNLKSGERTGQSGGKTADAYLGEE